jgi:transposase InsO family protein
MIPGYQEQSMTRITLPKPELVYLEEFDTHAYAHTAVFEYIEVFYNRQRCHAANGYLAPLAYERALQTHESLCPEKC